MILPFKTQLPDGKPTVFIEKIWCALLEFTPIFGLNEYENEFQNRFGYSWNFEAPGAIVPKQHTIRKDPHDRWREGSLIHPVVFNRSKNQFQFAPIMICKSTQNIVIVNQKDYQLVVVDDFVLYETESKSFYLDQKFKDLVRNDGFDQSDMAAAFFAWFNKDFSGKIIHWTDLKY